jgi:hypothetical protein
MRASLKLRRAFRVSRYESFEPRLLLSVTSPSQFQLDYIVEDRAFAEIQPTLGVAHDLTGWTQARSEYGLSGEGQTVVIIDTGIAYDHVALGGGFGNGFRVVGGYDFAEKDADPYDDGPLGSHGTHVAGILASTDFAFPGVAPGVDLVALRVFDDAGIGHFQWVEQALGWVHDHRNDFEHPITTVSLSIGSEWNGNNPPPWATLEEELAQLRSDGILVTAAAGNGFSTYGTSGMTYPAASPYVVPVSSVDPDGRLSFFSQRHDRAIAAPGRSIRSTIPDYVGNQNGVDDDFARYSGTSMAAPYLAGASVVLREACEFVDYSNITPDLIYGLMRSSADLVYDSTTDATYHRLNLHAALDEIMPEDDFGSSAESAHDLGQVIDQCSIEGTIERLNDRDFFQFTAAQTGEATLSVVATHGLDAKWELACVPGGSRDGSEVTFSAVAGTTYVVGLGSGDGIGHYRIGVQIDAEATEDPDQSCGQRDLLDYRISAAGQWIPLTAVRDGLFTVEACFSHAAGDVDLQLFDAGQRLIAGSYSIQDYERIDVVASAGQTFYLYAYLASHGTNDDVDFRTTNMVSRVGQTVEVVGTAGDDLFSFAAGSTHQLKVNGVDYQFSAEEVQAFELSGGAGADIAILRGTRADESAVLRVGSAQLTGPGYEVRVSGLEAATIVGRGGTDSARLFGSSGDDVLHATPRRAILSADGHRGKVVGFEEIVVSAGSGGYDIARLYDSPGNETFVGTPQWSELSGRKFRWRVEHFDAVHAQAKSGGYDVARLSDSAGNDLFFGSPGYARLVGNGFLVRAMRFDKVNAQATAGGTDTATLYDSVLDDHLETDKSQAGLSSALVMVAVEDFSRRVADSRHTGRDIKEVAAIDFLLGLVRPWQ